MGVELESGLNIDAICTIPLNKPGFKNVAVCTLPFSKGVVYKKDDGETYIDHSFTNFIKTIWASLTTKEAFDTMTFVINENLGGMYTYFVVLLLGMMVGLSGITKVPMSIGISYYLSTMWIKREPSSKQHNSYSAEKFTKLFREEEARLAREAKLHHNHYYLTPVK